MLESWSHRMNNGLKPDTNPETEAIPASLISLHLFYKGTRYSGSDIYRDVTESVLVYNL